MRSSYYAKQFEIKVLRTLRTEMEKMVKKEVSEKVMQISQHFENKNQKLLFGEILNIFGANRDHLPYLDDIIGYIQPSTRKRNSSRRYIIQKLFGSKNVFNSRAKNSLDSQIYSSYSETQMANIFYSIIQSLFR